MAGLARLMVRSVARSSARLPVYTGGLSGANGLLLGEAAGMALDFTGNQGRGYVTVKGHTTNLSNRPVDEFLTNSGTSPKLVLGSDGLYRWTAHNLLVWSEEFDNASWTKAQLTVSANAATAPDGTVTADKLQEDNTTNLHQAALSVTGVAGATYTWRVRAKAAERSWAWINAFDGGNFRTFFDLANGVVGTSAVGNTASITSLGNGWYDLTVSRVVAGNPTMAVGPASADNTHSYAGVTGSGIYAWGAQLNRGTVPTTYLATTSAARYAVPIEWDGSSKYYALVEPAATNLYLQSADLSNAAWTKTASGVTVTGSFATAPNGLTQASRVQFTAGSARAVYQNISLSAVPYTVSLWLKSNSGVSQQLRFATSSPGYSSEFTVTTDWRRFSFTFTPSAGTIGVGIESVAALPANDLLAWQGQIELGSIATSPIPTFGATVTRAADQISVATSAFPYSATASTVIIEAQRTEGSGTNNFIWQFDDDTANERFALYLPGSVSGPSLFAADGGVDQLGVAGLSDGSTTLGAFTKVAAALSLNDVAMSRDGRAVVTDTSFTMPTVNRLTIGMNQSEQLQLNGRIKRLVYLPRRATNAELQQKTAA